MQALKPISETAISRAEQADPNGRRCLVENCPAERAVELAYVFDRERSANAKMMTSIEWAWGMRKGSLNLDTHRNVFFLGASMHSLYKRGKWALLPPEELVDRYLAKPRGRYLGVPLDREDFPKIEGSIFQYSLLPLCDMSAFGITRQNERCDPSSADAYSTHVYPFHTFPILTSHVHPNFALLRLSRLLFDRAQDPYIIGLIRTRTLVAKVARVAVAWCSPDLPWAAKYDKTFITGPASKEAMSVRSSSESEEHEFSEEEPEEDDELNYQSSDVDSTCTPPHRIRCASPPSSAPPRVQSVKRLFTDLTQEEKISESGWTKEAISSWARECSALPELKSPDSPPPPLSTTDDV